MSKPTILQTLLGRPSQTYQFPPVKQYHSSKHDLFRTPTPASLDTNTAQHTLPSADCSHEHKLPSPPLTVATHDQTLYQVAPPLLPTGSSVRGSHEVQPALPPESAVGSNQHAQDIGEMPCPDLGVRNYPSVSSIAELAVTPPSTPRSVSHSEFYTDGESNESEIGTTDEGTDEEVFYTPRSSFYSSPRTSRASPANILDSRPFMLPSLSTLVPIREDGIAPSGASSESLTTPSCTTAEDIEESTLPPSGALVPASALSSRPRTADQPGGSLLGMRSGHSVGPDPPRVSVSSSSVSVANKQRKRRPQMGDHHVSASEEWAKDVRWLTPSSSSSRRRRRSVGYFPPLPAGNDPSRRRSFSTSQSQPHRDGDRALGSFVYPTNRGRMSALMEEDESSHPDNLHDDRMPARGPPSSSSRPPTRASSFKQEELGFPTDTRSQSSLRKSGSQRTSRSKATVRLSTTAPVQSSREPQSEDVESLEALESPDARVQAYARAHRRTYSHTRPLSRATAVPRSDTSGYTRTLPVHPLPTPPISSGPVSNGYTSLTMARAGYSGKTKLSSGGKVDLVMAGVARSTMATVEVVCGAAELSNGAFEGNRKTLSVPLKFLSIGRRGRKQESATPTHLRGNLPLPVAFMAHLAPPSFVPPSFVLVQVFAVGLDTLDSLLVQAKTDKATGSGRGFIPGRSLVGKVLECGVEVRVDVCKKGDWVIGLLDLKKSGALAEYVLLGRRRLHRAPQPRSRPTSLFPSMINRRSHIRSISLPPHLHELPSIADTPVGSYSHLSIEELALLPLNALPAHRAIRTLADIIVMRSPIRHTEAQVLPRVLVLSAHDGPGSMVVQMLNRRGAHVVAHVPKSMVQASGVAGDTLDISYLNLPSSGNGGSPVADKAFGESVESRLRAWGAKTVCVGDPVEVIERLAQDRSIFDAVIDTVGGVGIWVASQKVLLATSGHTISGGSLSPLAQFTTLVGDNPSKPIPSAQDSFRSGFRSFRRTTSASIPIQQLPNQGAHTVRNTSPIPILGGGAKASTTTRPKAAHFKRTVNYTWINVAADVDYEGEDVRDVLGEVVGMVEEGWIRPWIGEEGVLEGRRVVPFDRAPEVFKRDDNGPIGFLRDGGTCVIKIIP